MPSLNDNATNARNGTGKMPQSKGGAHPIIVRAAELLLQCAGFLDDTNAANRTDDRYYRTYYAVDVDTIMLYLQPYLKWSYLDIFGEGKESDTALALTFLLGEFLFKKSEPLIHGHEKQKHRFLIIPPHDQELMGTLQGMHHDILYSTSNIGPSEFQELTEAFTRYDDDGDEQALLTALREQFSDLVELFDPYRGPKAGLTRFASLPITTFQRVDAYYEEDFTFECLDPVNKDDDRRQANKLIGEWERRLYKYRSREQPQYALRNDAKVLASIEYINANLHGQGKRLALITGSHYIFQAAKGYKPWSEYGQTFDELYLRHPRVFLAHEKFFPEPETFKLIDWLNLFIPVALLPTNTSELEVDRNFLRGVINQDYESIERVIDTLARAGKDVKQILYEWQSQLTERVNAQYTDGLEFAKERGAIELADKLKQLRKTRWSIKDLRDLLLKEALTSTSTLYSLTLWIGLWSKSPKVKVEGIPELRFDGEFATLITYCEKVINLQRDYQEISLADLEDLLRQYDNEVQKVDPSLYHSHVIHALAFIAKGHWHATLTLATIAMSICDNILPAERGFLRGREAAYLACIAARRFASNRYWLEKARGYLDEACARENKGATEDIRFTAESLTLRTRSYYFDIFCENKVPDIKGISLIIRASCNLIDESNSEINTGIRLWVQRLTCTNLFTLLLISHHMLGDGSKFSHVEIVRYLDVFKKVLEKYQAIYERDDVQHSTLIYYASTAIWDSDPEKQQTARIKAIETIDKWCSFPRPYSKARLEMLKRILSPDKN